MIKKLTNADVTMRRGPKHSSVMIVESSELGHLFIEMGFRPGKKTSINSVIPGWLHELVVKALKSHDPVEKMLGLLYVGESQAQFIIGDGHVEPDLLRIKAKQLLIFDNIDRVLKQLTGEPTVADALRTLERLGLAEKVNFRRGSD